MVSVTSETRINIKVHCGGGVSLSVMWAPVLQHVTPVFVNSLKNLLQVHFCHLEALLWCFVSVSLLMPFTSLDICSGSNFITEVIMNLEKMSALKTQKHHLMTSAGGGGKS